MQVMSERATVKIDSTIKQRYEELSKELYGAKLSVSDKLETTLLKEIEVMEKELKKKK
jgi:hypothetical protein